MSVRKNRLRYFVYYEKIKLALISLSQSQLRRQSLKVKAPYDYTQEHMFLILVRCGGFLKAEIRGINVSNLV